MGSQRVRSDEEERALLRREALDHIEEVFVRSGCHRPRTNRPGISGVVPPWYDRILGARQVGERVGNGRGAALLDDHDDLWGEPG